MLAGLVALTTRAAGFKLATNYTEYPFCKGTQVGEDGERYTCDEQPLDQCDNRYTWVDESKTFGGKVFVQCGKSSSDPDDVLTVLFHVYINYP